VSATYSLLAPNDAPQCAFCEDYIVDDPDARLIRQGHSFVWECADCRVKHDELDAMFARPELDEEDRHGM
jgi:hypothetical protein